MKYRLLMAEDGVPNNQHHNAVRDFNVEPANWEVIQALIDNNCTHAKLQRLDVWSDVYEYQLNLDVRESE